MAGAKKERQRIEKQKHKEQVALSTQQRENARLEKVSKNIALPEIKKELVLFYKFLEKFVEKLIAMKNPNEITESQESEKKFFAPFISPAIAGELETLDAMIDLDVYSSELLQYALHFDMALAAHNYVLENKPEDLFVGHESKLILTPDSSYNLADTYTAESPENKALIRTFLTNMHKMTNRLNKQIDYDVINYILEKNKDTSHQASARYAALKNHYATVSLAKKTLKDFSGDTDGIIDGIVDIAANELKAIKGEALSDDDDDEAPDDYLKNNESTIEKVTSKITNTFGDKLISGEIDSAKFSKIANNVMIKMGKAKKGDKTLINIDVNKLKEFRDKCGGDFSKLIDMKGMTQEVLAGIGSAKPPGFSAKGKK